MTHSCKNCTHYSKTQENQGECRAHPPTIIPECQFAQHPTVDTYNWCGEFKPHQTETTYLKINPWKEIPEQQKGYAYFKNAIIWETITTNTALNNHYRLAYFSGIYKLELLTWAGGIWKLINHKTLSNTDEPIPYLNPTTTPEIFKWAENSIQE